MSDKIYSIERLDDRPKLIFIASIRFDPAGNIYTAAEYETLRDRKDFKQYIKAKIFRVTELDPADKKALTAALSKIESKVAREKASDLLLSFEDEDEGEDEAGTVTIKIKENEDLISLDFDGLKKVVSDEDLDCSIQSNWSINTNAKKVAEARLVKAA